MRISLSEAEGHWPDLVRRAEAGDEILITSDGKAIVRLVSALDEQVSATRAPLTKEQRRAILDAARAGAAQATPGPSAARSQDFLYDEDGLPG